MSAISDIPAYVPMTKATINHHVEIMPHLPMCVLVLLDLSSRFRSSEGVVGRETLFMTNKGPGEAGPFGVQIGERGPRSQEGIARVFVPGSTFPSSPHESHPSLPLVVDSVVIYQG